MPGDGLSLFWVGQALKKSLSSEGFERRLNSQGINNLDLNGDGMIDYVSVREFGAPPLMQYSLFVAYGPEEIVELATIGIQESVSGRARISIHGNEAIYGPRSYYNTSMRVDSFALYGYMYSPNRVVYISPYSLTRRPDYYQPTRTIERTKYVKKAESNVSDTSFKKEDKSSLTVKSKAVSPNAGKSKGFFSKLKSSSSKKPTSSQSAATSASSKSTTTKSSGWGSKTSSTTSSKKTSTSKSTKKKSSSKKKK